MSPDERIHEANSRMTMAAALQEAGADAYDGFTGKIFCPFGGIFHADGGREKAMRNYGDHAYCFAGCGAFTPVSLLALSKDISREDAAEFILERTGFVEPTWQARLQAVSDYHESIDLDVMADVLREECRRLAPDWEKRQYDPTVSAIFTRCLALLSAVRTSADARTWKTGVVKVMTTVLRSER